MDIESLLKQGMEPKKLRKRPSGRTKWLSYVWPIKVKTVESLVSGELEVTAWRGKYMLDTGKVNYSFGELHKIMDTTLRWLSKEGCKFQKVLMLGYGGGSAAEIIHQEYERDAEIIGIDLDGAILELAKDFFYHQGVRLMKENAENYIHRASKNGWVYDLVLVDLFVDAEVPSFVWEERNLAIWRSLIETGGWLAINTMMGKNDASPYIEALKTKFSRVETITKHRGNCVILCRC